MDTAGAERPTVRRDVRRWAGWSLAWLLAAAASVAVGLLAVSSIGASIRNRGPVGDNEVVRQAELTDGSPSVDPTSTSVQKSIAGEYGAFEVECRGTLALGLRAEPATATGWRAVSFEPGPDDDVDAVFANARRSVELEVFCNRGTPTLAELERHELPED